MLVQIPQLLPPAEVARFRKVLECSPWVDGRVTAGRQSSIVKNNLQVLEDHPAARELQDTLLGVLGRNPEFVSSALPLRVFPPLFNRYDAGMGFGAHIDNAIRFSGPVRFRTDLSATLFLTEPEDYDGGDLVIEDAYGEHAVKLAAGDLILYPASSLHRVEAITRGSRWAAFFWVQSMIADDGRRTILHDLDRAIQATTLRLGERAPELVALAGVYHNLIRQWAQV